MIGYRWNASEGYIVFVLCCSSQTGATDAAATASTQQYLWKLSCRGRATRPPNYSGCGNELGREGRLATQLFHQKSSFGSGIYYYGSCGKSGATAARMSAATSCCYCRGQIGLQKLHIIGAADCNNSNHDSCCCNCNKSSSLSRTGKSPLPGHQFLI